MTRRGWGRSPFVILVAFSLLVPLPFAMASGAGASGSRQGQPYVTYTLFVHTLTAGQMGDSLTDPLPDLFYRLSIDDILIADTRTSVTEDNASVSVDTSHMMNGTKDLIKVEFQLWDRDPSSDDQIDISPSHGSGALDIATPVRGATFTGQFDLAKRIWSSTTGYDVPLFNGEFFELDGSRDNDGDTVNEGKVTIGIINVNHPPELVRSVVYVDVKEDDRASVLLSDVFADKDGDQFMFSWDQNVPASFTFMEDRFSIVPYPDYHGTFSFDVNAIQGPTVLISTFHVNVSSVEDPPEPAMLILTDSTNPFTEVPLSAVGSRDGDGDALSFKWDFDLSDGIQQDAKGPMAFPVYDSPGVYIVTLTVSDGKKDVSVNDVVSVGTLEVGSVKKSQSVPSSFEMELNRDDTMVQSVNVEGEKRLIGTDMSYDYVLSVGMRFDIEVGREGRFALDGDMVHTPVVATTVATIEAMPSSITYSIRSRPYMVIVLEKVSRKEQRTFSTWEVETPVPTAFDEDGDASTFGGRYLWDDYASLRSPQACSDCLGQPIQGLSKSSRTSGNDLRTLIDTKGTFKEGPEDQFLGMFSDMALDTDMTMDVSSTDDVLIEFKSDGVFLPSNTSVPLVGRLSDGRFKVNATVLGPAQGNLSLSVYSVLQDKIKASVSGKVTIRYNLSMEGGLVSGGSGTFLSTQSDVVPTGRAARFDPHDTASTFTSSINRPPILAIDLSGTNVVMGEKLLIELGGSSDPENGALLFHIDYGDGNVHDWGAETKLSYIYAKPGTYTMKVTVKDNAGISSNETIIITVHPDQNWDANPPIVGINRPVNHTRQLENTLPVEWTGADDSGIIYFNISLDDGAWVPTGTVANHTLSGLSDGQHSIMVRVTDPSGNTAIDSIEIYIGKGFDDYLPPQVQITAPKDGERVRTTNVKVEWKAIDDGSGLSHFMVSLDGADPVRLEVSNSIMFYALGDGDHTVTVTAFDRTGNNASTTGKFTVDTSQEPTGLAAILGSMDPLTIVLIVTVIILAIGLVVFSAKKKAEEERDRRVRVKARKEKERKEKEEALAKKKAEERKKAKKTKKWVSGVELPEEAFEGDLAVTKSGHIEPDATEAAIPTFRSEEEKEKERQAIETAIAAELEARRTRRKGPEPKVKDKDHDLGF